MEAQEKAKKEAKRIKEAMKEGRLTQEEADKIKKRWEEEAKEKAKREAEEAMRVKEAEAKAKKEAEARAKREAEEKAKTEAKEKAKRKAEEAKKAKEAEARAKREAEEKAKKEAEARAKREAEEKAKEKLGREAEEAMRAELYEGIVKLTIMSPINLGQIRNLEEHLRQVQDLRLLLTGGSVDEGTQIIVSAGKPIPLIDVLREMPPVEQVVKKGKDIQVTLKAG